MAAELFEENIYSNIVISVVIIFYKLNFKPVVVVYILKYQSAYLYMNTRLEQFWIFQNVMTWGCLLMLPTPPIQSESNPTHTLLMNQIL